MDLFMEQITQIREAKAREEGLQEGEKQTRESMVHELLAQTEFSDEKIAGLTKIAVKEVAAIRKQLASK